MKEYKEIAINKIKEYLQGCKTIHELKTDLMDISYFKDIPDNVELPVQLLRHVGLDTFNCEELYDLPDAIATRQGLIHLLECYIKDEIKEIEINDWAENQFCWEIGQEQKDLLVDNILGELAMSVDYIKEFLTKDVIKRFIKILNGKNDKKTENIIFLLSFESKRQGLAFTMTEYKKGHNWNIDKFMNSNFDTDFENFIFRQELEKCTENIDENLKIVDRLHE
jgi:hypothetical protein